MKTTFTLFCFLAFLILSCKEEEIGPDALKGSWILQTIDIDFKLIGSDNEKSKTEVSKANYFIKFSPDGKFSSNTEFSLIRFIFENDISGTYEVNDGYLIEKYHDGYKDVRFFIKVTKVTEDELILSMDKESLTKYTEASAVEDQPILLFYLESADSVNIVFRYRKSKS